MLDKSGFAFCWEFRFNLVARSRRLFYNKLFHCTCMNHFWLQEWWTHLWLKEGFASFMEYLLVDHCFPEFDVWTQFVSEDLAHSLKLDALRNRYLFSLQNKSSLWIHEFCYHMTRTAPRVKRKAFFLQIGPIIKYLWTEWEGRMGNICL